MPVHVHMLEMVITAISKELHRETTRDHIIRPLIKWILWHIIPIIVIIMMLNFFITVAAISLVLYFKK